jgi:hypothetical protein
MCAGYGDYADGESRVTAGGGSLGPPWGFWGLLRTKVRGPVVVRIFFSREGVRFRRLLSR